MNFTPRKYRLALCIAGLSTVGALAFGISAASTAPIPPSKHEAEPVMLTTYIRGDVNLDGKVSDPDLSTLLKVMASQAHYKVSHDLSETEFKAAADVNNDGNVSNSDIQALIDLINGS